MGDNDLWQLQHKLQKFFRRSREAKLRQPIDEYVGKIQAQIDELRTDGTEKAVNIQNELDNLKRDRIYTAQENGT